MPHHSLGNPTRGGPLGGPKPAMQQDDLDAAERAADFTDKQNEAATREYLLDHHSIGAVDGVCDAKVRILNRSIQGIGMGRYQCVMIGLGWANANLWPVITSLILVPVANEFKPSTPLLLTLAQNIGLFLGALFWGFSCDVFGRKWGFNLTLCITSMFGMLASAYVQRLDGSDYHSQFFILRQYGDTNIDASSPNFAAIACSAALWSFGAGGSLPVDSAIFLEFLPASHQYLLTILSIDWSIAQVVATLIAWPLLGNMTCQEEIHCTAHDNLGWRYFIIVMGLLALVMFMCRYLFFTIYESPKYYIGQGMDERAVAIIHEVARRNGTTTDLTVEELKMCEPAGYIVPTRISFAVKRRLERLDPSHVRALFRTSKDAFSTSMLMTIWALLGLGYPLYNAFLPYLLAIRGAQFGDGSAYVTYQNSLIISVLGVPGAFLGGLLVELKCLGRKRTLAGATLLTGTFLYASTTSMTSGTLLAYNCAFSFFSNIMYSVLYAYTPEVFPTMHRGTGNALTAASNRFFGMMAPIIAIYADLNTSTPVYVSGALFFIAGFICLVLPYESQGKASL